MTFLPGEPALYRFIRYGKVRMAVPHVVVRDDPELVALYVAAGTRGMQPMWSDSTPIRGQADRDWELRVIPRHTFDVLRLIRPGKAHALELLWRTDGGDFAGWYVNLQEPLRRATLGFDTDDLVLDVWIQPDGSWAWKDEDELEVAVELGRFTPREAAAIRAEGERVLAERPWPTGWEDWRPDPEWPEPTLAASWERV